MLTDLPLKQQVFSDSKIIESVSNPHLLCPKVLHMVLSLECGGLEQVVVDLVRLSQENGHKAEVLCFERPGILADQLIEEGVPVHCLHKPAGLHLGIRKEIAKVLGAIQPEVVHTHQIGTLFYSGPVAVKCGVGALLHTEHGKEYSGRRRTRWLGRIAARHVETFCCVSDDTARHVLQNRIVPRRKIKLVYNGVDIERFQAAKQSRHLVRSELGISTEDVVVGTVGRLSEIKRQDVLIEGFSLLSEQRPNAHLLLVGEGPQRSKLEQLVTDRRLQSRVHFVGYQVDRERYLSAMDIFALTSDSEGTPLALLEAWSAGLAVVVTAVGGMPELVQDNLNGNLVPPRDRHHLAKVFLELIDNVSIRQRLGQVGIETVQSRFDRRKMAREYAALYQELLSKR